MGPFLFPVGYNVKDATGKHLCFLSIRLIGVFLPAFSASRDIIHVAVTHRGWRSCRRCGPPFPCIRRNSRSGKSNCGKSRATGSLSEVEEQTKAIANLKSVSGRCPVTGKKTFAAALIATLNSKQLFDRALHATARRSGAGAMASIVFMKKPIAEADFSSPPSFEKHADHSKFGVDPHTFYLKTFAHLTMEASINLWGTLRDVELEQSK